MRETRHRTSWGLYRWILNESRPYASHLGGMLLLGLLSIALALLLPLPLKLAVDSVLGDEPFPAFMRAVLPGFATGSTGAALVVVVVLSVAIVLLSHLQGLAYTVLSTYTGEKLVLGFRARLFRHAQRLSLAYHDSRGTSDSSYRIQYDAPGIQWVAVEGIIPFVTSILTLFSMVYVTALIDAQLALVALAIVPLLLVVLKAYGRRLRDRWHSTKNLESSILSGVQEVLGGVRIVKAFGQEDREEERFVRRSRENVRAQMRLALLEGTLGLMVGVIIAAGTAAVLYIGVRHVQNGTLTLGSLLLVMGYLTQLYGPLEEMSHKVTDLQAAFASVERGLALLDEAPDVHEKPDARPLGRARGAVAFEEVSFSYDGETPTLRGVSFSVEPGTRVGIAGTTGAGKTTLVSLLTRFYDPTDGAIELDGTDLRDYKVADLRNQFAIVLQDPVLFSTSIAENIAYARPGASMEEVKEAARSANAHGFISHLPEGYDTLVGERGQRLSGGERQRVSLARAFLKDAPILILDEPTSSVDVKTEGIIMDAMDKLMHGRTTFMIAHRLSTLEHCDRRLVIEHGRLVSAQESTTRRKNAS